MNFHETSARLLDECRAGAWQGFDAKGNTDFAVAISRLMTVDLELEGGQVVEAVLCPEDIAI